LIISSLALRADFTRWNHQVKIDGKFHQSYLVAVGQVIQAFILALQAVNDPATGATFLS
jgi:hypothetical protein